MIKEEKSREKWCPFARAPETHAGPEGELPVTINRYNWPGAFPEGAACIGEKCMAWRYMQTDIPDWIDHGYCGLAGTPRA